VLRQLLAHYLGSAPSELRFHRAGSGKPFVAKTPSDLPLCFNVSHSEDLALIAFTYRREVGIDVEWVKSISEMDQIAERYFCPSERELLRRSRADTRPILFHQYWTRKEAIVKATGDGLSVRLDRIDVSTVAEDRLEPITLQDGLGLTRHLSVIDLQPKAGYVGALAVEGGGCSVARWRWPIEGEAYARLGTC